MTGTRTAFTDLLAPCGRKGGGEHFVEEDGDGLLIRDDYFDCGCRRIRHEYHDGSIHVHATRHDGRRATDEFGPDHGC
ncbi:hypothetical protein Acor_07000 [Acrocarpospora corrugata]|uniref:Uncharacterized protein n=1 Tax=Acrocarpospora corrugata TaxID=35763 RepID=A0A5M3VR19_9ACTN|nr:hypothetical protein [Acrocarpospora corrugata]GER98638.1 hypothetical protein Acor_07000 [Acrocarpospora corrugata]